MECLTLVVEKISDYAFNFIRRQAGYLIFYERNFKALAAHVKDLEAERERIVHSIEEERGNGKTIERDVVNWLEKVNEVIERANQLQNDPRRANVRCFTNLSWRHKLSRNATQIDNDVQAQEKGTFDRVGYLPTIDGIATYTTKDSENYGTRETLKDDIVKALGDLNSCNIGVYGLGGVGKTTLVEDVALIAKQHKLFDKVVITHVSENPDFKTIQGEIADLLGLRFDEETILGRAHRLRERIKMEKSILIILDNIWTVLDLKKVGIPFGKEHNGCKLLMTCRNQDVLLQMDVSKNFTFKLELMTENETWNLFQLKVGDVIKDNNLKDIAVQIAQKCEGLPLRVVAVALAMRNKRDVQSWEYALKKLQNNGGIEMEGVTYSALELSYESLESDEMMDLFLLFALLLGNDAKYFLQIAMGLGILKHNTMDDARNKLYTMIKSLEATCLLEVKTGGKIQMHDFVRDFATSIACRDKHVFLKQQSNDNWPTKDFLGRCTQIVVRFPIHKFPEMFDCPNIKFVLFTSENRSLEVPDNIFEGMGSLTVLDLTCFNFSSLPISFWFLTNLQTLCLDSCILENMDAIEGLKNLQILRICKSSMIKLPSAIGKLTQLRMLDLSDSGIEVFPSNILSSLTKLEELYIGNTSINWEDVNSMANNENASIAELHKLPNLTALELQIRETWMLPRNLRLMFEKLKRFKIAIGDVWEWADIKDETLKTLMLKLDTNIHLQYEIKALIKGVENLYLDNVDGIQNVLYNLSLDGFPLLKHLLVQNNANMKHIVNSKERNQIHVCFPILETLILHNLENLEHICHGPLSITSFGSLSVIKVKNCVQLKYLLSFTMAKGLSQLSKIEVSHCNSMKEIVLGDNNSSANNDITNEKVEFHQLRSLTLEYLETLDNFFSGYLTHSKTKQNHQGLEPYVSTPFFNAQVAFPNLDNLKLSSLNLNNIWDDNLHSMYNLTSLIVDNCGGLKYLFSSTVVGCFKNLQHLEISNCAMMEEIIAKEEENNPSKEVHFCKLEKIILKYMDNLKSIWHRQFERLKMLQVDNCNKIVVIFPSSMQKRYNELEMLEVTNCASVEEIFELSFKESSSVEDTTHLTEVTIDGLPKLKKIWSGDPQGILSFQNLINVKLESCESLEYPLPFSVATRCSHLKELRIISCANMKEIVEEEKESSSVNAAPIFEFNQLSTLLLWGLLRLKGFYAKEHTVLCPSLNHIDVIHCAKLNLYRTLSTRSSNIRDDKLSGSMQQPPFIVEEVIPNLENLRTDGKDANMILQTQNSSGLFTKMKWLSLCDIKNEYTFPYWFLENVRNLESLFVEQCDFKKIFQDEGKMREKTGTQIKMLTLSSLPNLQHICEEGSQNDTVLEFLQILFVNDCSSLINLFPYSVSFSNVEQMEITNCNGLRKLLTSPTAHSLDKLLALKVKKCNSLEEIISGEEIIHITFISLQILWLECLPNLNQFCSSKCFFKFPLLEEVFVRGCPRMKIFSEGYISTPNLRKVKIAENDEQWFWKGNLNDTISNMFEDKVAFRKLTYLALSNYPEMKDLWYDQNPFCNLKHLVVNNCDFLSHVLFPSNVMQVLYGLEELEVTDCDSLEVVFDVKGMKSTEERLMKQSTQLKTLTLSDLPKLKQIWNEDPHEIINFGNLGTVNVSNCQSLSYIFSLSLCEDLKHLEMLEIVLCGVEEIVAMEEGSMEHSFNFPQLNKLTLKHLTDLTSFYRGKHSLDCPSLKVLDVYGCDTFNHLDMFSIEKLSCSLEKLTINATNLLEISNQENIFQKVQTLSLEYWLDETPTNFLNEYCHSIFPNLDTLKVNQSSFETLFPTTSYLSMQILKQIKNLNLYGSEMLKQIWEEDFPLDHPLLQDLHKLFVFNCPSLISLVPSSTSFTNLTILTVVNCKELNYLITSSTAKSLIQLTALIINNCESMLDIVKIDDEKADQKDIIFENLEFMEFTSLSSLGSFCNGNQTFIFPSLTMLNVKECPQMKIFSSGVTVAPYLTEIEVGEGTIRWKDDINTTIQHLFHEKMIYLALSDYPEMKDLWYDQNVFCNLKHLVVHNCDFLSHGLFPSNVMQVLYGLEELEVTDCDSLEVVFDVKGMKSKDTLIKQRTQLKKLTLYSLPKLKHIWNEDPHEIINFGNLCTVNVSACRSLSYIFSLSLCKDLGHLEMLEIEYCGVEEIVAMEEGSPEHSFNFPRLKKLRLSYLANLTSFYRGKHFLDCPSLKELDVSPCAFNHLDLFSTEKLSHNLEKLTINGTDLLEISNQENIFQKVQTLYLQCFDETPSSFLNEYSHTIFPNLETIQVRNSSLETLFPTTGCLSMQTSKQIKILILFELEMLKHIWQEDFPLDHPLLKDLNELYVWDCPSLISFVPSSTSFTNLTCLVVHSCKELNHLITSSTAKSLIQLQTLHIKNCEKMLDVVKIDDVKADQEDIIFENLEEMELTSLSSLGSFCYGNRTFIFPSLQCLIVKECPEMEIFSSGVTLAPYLTKIEVGEETFPWKGDINTTIQHLFQEKEDLRSNAQNETIESSHLQEEEEEKDEEEVIHSNTPNETIVSSHSQDNALGGQDGIDASLEE